MKNIKPWLFLAASVMLVGCSGNESEESGSSDKGSTNETGEITAWAWDPAFNIKALDLANEQYTKDNSDF